ncbi:MAG: protein kinase, partial [Acidobacteriota bacterium]
PEQARGLELDHRSDLFSFGVLLYELLTGRSPFRAEATLETLNRVCTARQRPVRELRPAVPQGLSDLVDDLLEKDPDLRPAAAQKVRQRLEGVASAAGSSEEDQETVLDSPIGRTVGAAGHVAKSQARVTGRWRAAAGALTLSLLLLAAALLLWRGRPQSGPPLYVAVLRPEIARGQETPGSEILAAAVHTEILRGLLAREGLAPLAPEQVDAVAGPPAQVARATAADEVVAARLDCESAVCHVSLHRVGTNGALLWAGSFAAPIDQPYLVSEAIAGQLGATYRDHHARHEAGELDVRPADYAEYLRLYRSFDLKRE